MTSTPSRRVRRAPWRAPQWRIAITFDDLELRAGETVEGKRQYLGIGTGAGAWNQQLVLLQIGESLDLRRMPRHCQADVAVHAAEPGEFERIDVDLVLAEHRLERQAAPDRAHDGAVLGRNPVDVLFDLEPTGTQHVLHNDDWLARNVVAEVACQHAGVNVVGRAGAGKDQHGQLAALVELLDRLCGGTLRRGCNQQSCSGDGSRAHGKSLRGNSCIIVSR